MIWLLRTRLPDAELVARVTRGEKKAAVVLVDRLLPCIQRRVGWVLSRHRPSASREELLDYTQDVLLRLFERDYQVLKSWDTDRGASLATFVGVVAEREVLTALRSGRRSAWREDPTLDVDAARDTEAPSLQHRVEIRQKIDRLLDRLRQELTPRTRALFQALFIEEQPPEKVASEFGMSMNALYSWRSRLRGRLKEWDESEEGYD